MEAFFKGKSLKFDLLRISKKGVHAELGMIDAILERQSIILGQGPQYIGISRLCCPKCELVIKINFNM